MDLTYIILKDQMRKEVKNFGWEVDDQFYTFWLNEEKTKVLSVPVKNVRYVEDKL